MDHPAWGALLNALKNLNEMGFQSFCCKLRDSQEGQSSSLRLMPENADCEDVVSLMRRTFSYPRGIKLAVSILNDINESQVAGNLKESLKKDMVNFINEHSLDLIRDLPVVDPIIDKLLHQNLLTVEQYYLIHSNPTSPMKMRELYKYVRGWKDGAKVTLYELLLKYNENRIRNLIHQDKQPLPPPPSKKEHFVDRHQEELIQVMTLVQPILQDLRKNNLLTLEQFNIIQFKQTPHEKMKMLYTYVREWNSTQKNDLYSVLLKWNGSIVKQLEKKDMGQSIKPSSQKPTDVGESEAGTSSSVDMSSEAKPKIHKKSDFKSEKIDPEQSELSLAFQTAEQTLEQVSIRDHCLECRLCGKAQYKATVLVPETIEFERSYRLKIEYPGFFRCNYTGIQFLVSDAVIIEYTLESWFIYFPEIQKNGYKIAGPLFNIKTNGESDKILELYLPHHLCLHGITEQDVQIKCAHFTDENLLLETPAKIEPFYVVLLKPKFSLWGPIQWILGKKTPVHANVLTYFRVLCMDDPENRAYRIHLYLLSAPFLNEQALNRRKSSFMFQKMDKPPQTLHSMYADTNYDVQGEPDVHVVPKVLQIDTSYLSVESLPFTEINFKQNEISIQVLHQDNIVWQAFVLKEDIQDFLKGKHERKQNESFPKSVHFVLEHREALIQRLPMVEPILDELHAQNILTDEAYETVSNEGTTQMKVRKLFKFVRSWGRREMDVLLEALRKHQSPLIEDLERSSSEESED